MSCILDRTKCHRSGFGWRFTPNTMYKTAPGTEKNEDLTMHAGYAFPHHANKNNNLQVQEDISSIFNSVFAVHLANSPETIDEVFAVRYQSIASTDRLKIPTALPISGSTTPMTGDRPTPSFAIELAETALRLFGWSWLATRQTIWTFLWKVPASRTWIERHSGRLWRLHETGSQKYPAWQLAGSSEDALTKTSPFQVLVSLPVIPMRKMAGVRCRTSALAYSLRFFRCRYKTVSHTGWQ